MQEAGIRVLIVDDSRFIARKLEELLSEDQAIRLVKKAYNGEEALDLLERFRPNCITLDVHMPGMNGLTVLKHIMIRCPTPTLMVSSYTSEGSWITFDALRYGAVDFYKKPSGDSPEALEAEKRVLCEKVKRASKVKVQAARFIRLGHRRIQPDSWSGQASSGHGRAFLFLGGTGGYASVLQLLSMANLHPQDKYYFFLDVPSSCLEGFSRYVGASYGLKAAYCHRGANLPKEVSATLIFSDEMDFLIDSLGAEELTVVALSGEGVILERFLTRLGLEKGQIIALDPGACLVPEMVEDLISNGARAVSHQELSRIIEG